MQRGRHPGDLRGERRAAAPDPAHGRRNAGIAASAPERQSADAETKGGRSHLSQVDWITFDCYGTLIDWERGVADALTPFLPSPVDRRGLAARYIAIEAVVEHEAYRRYRDVLAEASGRLMAELGHPLPPGRARVLPDSLPSWPPFPEVPEVLRALRSAGHHLGILSNVDGDLIATSIGHLGIEPDLVITAEDCGSYKPAPAHWTHFQTRSGATPDRTVHVGASLYHDVVTAGTLGYRTIFVNRHEEPIVGARPTRVLRDLRQLPETIAELVRAPS